MLKRIPRSFSADVVADGSVCSKMMIMMIMIMAPVPPRRVQLGCTGLRTCNLSHHPQFLVSILALKSQMLDKSSTFITLTAYHNEFRGEFMNPC